MPCANASAHSSNHLARWRDGRASWPGGFDYNRANHENISAGTYRVHALDVIARGQAADSPDISLDAEPGAACAQLVVEPNHIELEAVDIPYPWQVGCVFADGTRMDITHSTQVRRKSFNASVVTVDQHGRVRLVGPG